MDPADGIYITLRREEREREKQYRAIIALLGHKVALDLHPSYPEAKEKDP